MQRIPAREAVTGAAGAMIDMIPEGLILLTSVALAVGVAKRMHSFSAPGWTTPVQPLLSEYAHASFAPA